MRGAPRLLAARSEHAPALNPLVPFATTVPATTFALLFTVAPFAPRSTGAMGERVLGEDNVMTTGPVRLWLSTVAGSLVPGSFRFEQLRSSSEAYTAQRYTHALFSAASRAIQASPRMEGRNGPQTDANRLSQCMGRASKIVFLRRR
jgi:hypothetical protein